jgi:O-antigen/teichoic acid export membrane protein
MPDPSSKERREMLTTNSGEPGKLGFTAKVIKVRRSGNLPPKKTTINLTSVIGGEMLLRGANFAAAAVIGRLYGVVIFGTYATVLAFVTVVERLSDNGLEVAGIAETSKQPERTGEILGSLYTLKTFLSLLALAVLVCIGLASRLSSSVWLVATLLTLRTFLYSYCRLQSGTIKSWDRMSAIGVIQATHFGVLACGLSIIYIRHYSLASLLLLLLTGQSLEFLLSFLYLRRLGIRPRMTGTTAYWKMIRSSTPIGITYTVAALILRGDVIILSLLVPAALLGSFAAANTGLVTVYVVAWLFGGVILSRMAQLAKDSALLSNYVRKWVLLILATATPVSLFAGWVAPSLVSMLFGRPFASAASSAAIMALAVPFILLNAVFLSGAIAREASFEYLGIFLGVGIISVTLDFVLGRAYGANGVAWAIALRELIMSLAFGFCAVWDKAQTNTPVIPATTDMVELAETVDA